MTVWRGRSRRRVSSRILVTPSEAWLPLATMRGFQPNSGRYLANFSDRCTPAPPRGGNRYDKYNSDRVNSTAPDASIGQHPRPFDGQTAVLRYELMVCQRMDEAGRRN